MSLETPVIPGGATPDGYPAWLATLKARIGAAQLRAALAVNSELLALYWSIGQDIRTRQAEFGWGAKIVDRLAADLRAAFPDARGFSPANLRYMRAFAEAWPDAAILQRAVGKLPWGQNIELLAVKDQAARLWYAEAALENGWSRAVLAAQIDSDAHARQGAAITNFGRTLPPAASDLARQTLKDPYQFGFLSLSVEVKERELEQALIGRVKDLLLELGRGFAFIGSQHRLEVGGQEFYIDLLFYHRRLRCLVAVDLKTGAFLPEHAGKMNFYLSALDDAEREAGDNPSIGLILCRTHNRLVVEYALRNVEASIGVARYQLMQPSGLPERLAAALPSGEEIAARIMAPEPDADAP